jgi:hypothetical protein
VLFIFLEERNGDNHTVGIGDGGRREIARQWHLVARGVRHQSGDTQRWFSSERLLSRDS